MVKRYSITKYFLNNKNLVDEWTSMSDIGNEYNGKTLDIEQYIQVEDSYVNAIMEICKYMNISDFHIKNVCKWKKLSDEIDQDSLKMIYSKSMLNTYENVTDNSNLNFDELCDLIRLELREDIGGLLYVPYRLKIFIGYDYMMGVHSSVSLNSISEKIKSLGLNIYEF